MAGRPVSANADGDAAFGPLGTGQPPEWSVTGRPAQEGDEDRSTWLTRRLELGRNDTRAVLRRTLMSSSADRGHRRERPGAPRRLARPRHQGQKSAFGSHACLGHWDDVGAIRAGASTGRAGHRLEVCGE